MKNENAMREWEELAFKNNTTDKAVNDLLEKIAGDKYKTDGDDPIVETIESLDEKEVEEFMKGCKAIRYRYYLEDRLNKATEDFNKAKEKAIRDLENLHTHDAAEYGATYYTHIDHVTQAGARVEELKKAIWAFDFLYE